MPDSGGYGIYFRLSKPDKSGNTAVNISKTQYPISVPDSESEPAGVLISSLVHELKGMEQYGEDKDDEKNYMIIVNHSPFHPIRVTFGVDTKTWIKFLTDTDEIKMDISVGNADIIIPPVVPVNPNKIYTRNIEAGSWIVFEWGTESTNIDPTISVI